MYKLKCLYISESGKSASFAVTQNYGPVNARIATGFMELENPDAIDVGSELTIEAQYVDTVTSTTEDGREFQWLVFEV